MNEVWLIVSVCLLVLLIGLVVLVIIRQARLARQMEASSGAPAKAVSDMLNPLLTMQKNQVDSIDRHLELSQRQSANINAQSEEFRRQSAQILQQMAQENREQLNKIQLSVDQQLSGALQKRLDSSFSQVSLRLEQVYKGLGEMQELAKGVGDLRRMLTNVKVRGVFGETQLEALLEEVFSPEQYIKNAAVKERSQERVEFAIRMPGRGDDPVLLPIDSKFPLESYLALVNAQELGDAQEAEKAGAALEKAIKEQAKKIGDKYINPPVTTDFALMFLPTEGLYAEVIRRDGLSEELSRRYRVVPCGPTTILALLNSLQMGFRSIAIEKRSSEVFRLLTQVRRDFEAFSTALDKTSQRIRQAGESIDDAQRRTQTLQRRLRAVGDVEEEEAPDA